MGDSRLGGVVFIIFSTLRFMVAGLVRDFGFAPPAIYAASGLQIVFKARFLHNRRKSRLARGRKSC